MKRPAAALAAIAACAFLLGACTGIPGSSVPSTVETVPVDNGDGGASVQPQPDAIPRTIVSDFLLANAADSGQHASARAFLTPAARNQWSDQGVHVVSDLQLGTYDAAKRSLTVTARQVGTISADGIYTPSLLGTGNGGATVPFQFILRKINGQYRIDQLRSGLLITVDQFRQTYQQHILYYYDLADRYLVPDVRWRSISSTDNEALVTWLIDLLVSAPSPQLQDVVSTDTFPAQANANHILVHSVGGNTVVEIPGSAQLVPAAQNRLALQLAETLAESLSGGTLTITDDGTPITIPALETTAFTAANFTTPIAPAPPSATVYYLRNGHIVDETGKAITGPLGTNSVYLTSIAVARRASAAGQLSVAATTGSGHSQRLEIGTQRSGVTPTSVRGELSTPVWAPGLSEVWVGVGSTVHRITVNGTSVSDSVVQVPPTAGGGRVMSIHFSPDGSRLALVIDGSTGSSAQLYVAAVVRDAGSVRLSALEPVSPAGVVVTDADWSSSFRLIAIGYNAASTDADSYETGVDGSSWTSKGTAGLPPAPLVSVTAPASSAKGAWVECGGQVWEEYGDYWQSPSSTGQALGTEPAYLS